MNLKYTYLCPRIIIGIHNYLTNAKNSCMKRKNYFVLMLLAVLTFSLSSCVVVEDNVVINTPEALCNRNWVDVYYGTDQEGKFQCEHTIRFNLNGTGYERFVYREVDLYNNVGAIYQDDNGLVNPQYAFNWEIGSSSSSLYMSIILDNNLWDFPKKFRDMEVRRNTLTGVLDGGNVTFYNRGY